MNNHIRRILLIALILAGALLFSSCHRSRTPAAKRYPFTGRVVSVDTQAQSAIIDGDAIPGFMEAMAMPYKVKPAATLNHLMPGDSISAEVVVQHDSRFRRPLPTTGSKTSRPPPTSIPSRQLAPTRCTCLRPAKRSLIFHLPIRQASEFLSSNIRGKVLFLTFIYTRCPFPDFCPRMSSNFAEIYKQIGTNPALAGAHLLSISFDPEHDTPKVLRDYGFSVAHTHDPALFKHWEFAAASQADLPKIADFFALTVKPENGLITHNLSTAVIGPDGKIVKWYHGSDWQPSDLIKDAAAAPAH